MTEDMKIGIAKIDDQHQELFDRFNELSSLASETVLKEEVRKTLDLLDRYVVQHFSDEEEIQKECNYPLFEWHKELHKAFVQTFQKLEADFIAGGTTTAFIINLDNALVGWLKHHITSADVEFGKYYRECHKANQ
jgi:hemerythrin-like metal-binding protein